MDGLGHVGTDPVAKRGERLVVQRFDRPGTQEVLVEEVFLVAVGGLLLLDPDAVSRVRGRPSLDGLKPAVGNLREHVDSRPNVLAPLGVVSGERGQTRGGIVWPGRWFQRGATRGHAESVWLSADLVERDQPVIDVERRILQALGRDRSGHLLELAGEVGRGRRIVGQVGGGLDPLEQDVAQEPEDGPAGERDPAHRQSNGTIDEGPVLLSHAAGVM